MPAYLENGQNVTVARFGLAFTQYWHNLKKIKNSTVNNSIQYLQEFDAKEPFSLFGKRWKMFCFHPFSVFTRCRFQILPVRVPFSKSTAFKIRRQKCAVVV